MDNQDYLKEGYDPSSLKMPGIRNILNKHDVSYPSNAKKPDLLNILQKEVLDKAPKLRKQAKKAKRAKADGRDIEVVTTGVSSRTRSSTPKLEEDEEGGDDKEGGKRKIKKAKGVVSGKKKQKKPVENPPSDDLEPAATSRRHRQIKAKAGGLKRKLSESEDTERTGDSGDERFFTPNRPRQRLPLRSQETTDSEAGTPISSRRHRMQGTPSGRDNFSDDNPFQSSPETSRKRRRKATNAGEQGGGGLTPTARKSQVSDLSFKVALPGQQRNKEDMEDMDVDMAEDIPQPPETPTRATGNQELMPFVSDEDAGGVKSLIAKYQQQQQQPIQPPPPPQQQQQQQYHHHQKPETSSRFTMTPSALRELATSAKPPVERPPVAPMIPVTRVSAAPRMEPLVRGEHRRRISEQPSGVGAAKGEGGPTLEDVEAEAQALQRRRVATLRQHQKEEGEKGDRHRRRSSIASIASNVSEARGIPAIPASEVPPANGGSEDPAVSAKSTSSGVSWFRKLAIWVSISAAAAAVWRTQMQFSVGFGNTRSDNSVLAPPKDSLLMVPERPADLDQAPVEERAIYYAKYVTAHYLAPPALSCPEHAECVPYTSIIQPQMTSESSSSSSRNKWLVPISPTDNKLVAVVQCDPGYVLQFPWWSTKLLPAVPQCVKDISTELRVRQLTDAMVRACSAKHGQAQCEKTLFEQVREMMAKQAPNSRLARLLSDAATTGDGGQPLEEDEEEDDAEEIERLGLSSSELRKMVWKRKTSKLTDEEMERLFKLSLGELVNKRGDVVANFILEDEDHQELSYFVAKHPELPTLCRARRMVLRAVLGHITYVCLAVGLVVLGFVGKRRLGAAKAEKNAADALVGAALARLKRQAHRHYLDPALSPSPSIPSLQLRDLLLINSSQTDLAYYDPRARNGVWERVRGVVERNANVRCRTTAVRGEPMRVWEWIGPLEDDEEFYSN